MPRGEKALNHSAAPRRRLGLPWHRCGPRLVPRLHGSPSNASPCPSHPRGAGRSARRDRLLLRPGLDRRPAGRAAGGRPGEGDAGGRLAAARDGDRAPSRDRPRPVAACRRRQRRDGGLPAGIFPGAGRGVRGDGEAGVQLPRLDRQHRRLGAAADRERALCRRDRHELRRQPVRPRQPAQRHDRPRDAADPAQRLPDDPGHLRQVDPGQSGQVQLLHRRARARQSVAAAGRGAGLSEGHVERDGLCRRRLLQRREPWRQHAGADPGLGRRCDGELRLHHAGPKRGDPGARAHGHRRRRRLEPREGAGLSVQPRPSARSRA